MNIKQRVKPEQFVRLWLEAYRNGQKISWIAETMGVSDASVSRMASSCRKNGVKLPNLRRTFTETINVNAMNKMISLQLDKKV
jgi:DNA-binding transcriptional regulator LsrR (DeoR family)